MGWAYGVINGREVGYGVADTCHEPGCDKRIDRGLAYCCGGDPWNEFGCHDYFCGEHLYFSADDHPQMCAKCLGMDPD